MLGIIVAGGLTGASPAICPLPASYVARTFRSASQTPLTRDDVDKTIDRLGAFDIDSRIKATQAVRRAPGTVALPALVDAAAGHADGFVRYRALVLLSGYDDPRVPDQMEQALDDVNDRLRAVGFAYFERHPETRLVPAFLKALDKEQAEFVRPALLRALAAHDGDKRVRPALVKEITSGPALFRTSLVEALGDYKVAYALKPIADLAARAGPSRDEAVLAIGKIGDKTSVALVAGLSGPAGSEVDPAAAAALCLLGSDCNVQRELLTRTLTATGGSPVSEDRLRAAASGLSALAANGDAEAGRALVSIGLVAVDPVRRPVATALAGLAVRQPLVLVALLEGSRDRAQVLELLRQGFDVLADDFRQEQFFVALRSAYFAEPEGSARRTVIQSVINALEY